MSQDSDNIKLAFLSWNMENPFTRNTEYTNIDNGENKTEYKDYMNCINDFDEEKEMSIDDKQTNITKILEFFEKFILLQINLLNEFIMDYFVDNNTNILFINLQEIFLWNEKYYSKSFINNLNYLYKNFGMLIHYFYKEKYESSNIDKYLDYHISYYNKFKCSGNHLKLSYYNNNLNQSYHYDNKLINFQFKIKHQITNNILCFNYAEINGNYRQLGTLCVYISKIKSDNGDETSYYHDLGFETIEYDDTYVLKTYLYNNYIEDVTKSDSDNSDTETTKKEAFKPPSRTSKSFRDMVVDLKDSNLGRPGIDNTRSKTRASTGLVASSSMKINRASTGLVASSTNPNIETQSDTDRILHKNVNRIKASIYNCHINRGKYNGSKLIKSILKYELKLNDKRYKPNNLFFMGDFNEDEIEMDLYGDELFNFDINQNIKNIRTILKNQHSINNINFKFDLENLTSSTETDTDTDTDTDERERELQNKLLKLEILTECKYNNGIDNFTKNISKRLRDVKLSITRNILTTKKEILNELNTSDIDESIKVILNDLKLRKKITSKLLNDDYTQEVTGVAKELLLHLISLIDYKDKKNIVRYKLNNIIKSTNIDYIIEYSRLINNKSSDSNHIFPIYKYDKTDTSKICKKLDILWEKYSKLLSQKYILNIFKENEVFNTFKGIDIASAYIDDTVKEQLSRRDGFQRLSDHYFNFAQFELISDTKDITNAELTDYTTINKLILNIEDHKQSQFTWDEIYEPEIINTISELHKNIKVYDENILEIYSELLSIIVGLKIDGLKKSEVLNPDSFRADLLKIIKEQMGSDVQSNTTDTTLIGGNIEYYNKYLKYKNKYLNLLHLK